MTKTTSASQVMERLKGLNIPNVGKIPALFKREYLDQRTGLFTMPMIVAGLTLFALILGLVTAEYQMGSDVTLDLGNVTVTIDGEVYSEVDIEDEIDGQKLKEVISKAFTGAISLGILLILPFVVFFSLLGTLYDDRRERSYLFWKSMPVSDTKEVLTKFGFNVFAGPLVLFGWGMALGLFAMTIVTPFIWAHGGSAFDLLWGPAPFLSMWIATAMTYWVLALWILPILAWLILASAFAPKKPLIYAAVPIIAIAVGESIIGTGSFSFLEMIGSRFEGFGHIMAEIFDHGNRMQSDEIQINVLRPGDAWAALLASLANGKFWIGQLFTVAFLAGAVYLRRYRV
jgi:ABC-2 type transport system permease protein